MVNEFFTLRLIDRNSLEISGVKEIIAFDNEIITLFTDVGDLSVRGSDLIIDSAFTQKGNVIINGRINSLSFSDNNEKITDNIIARLFR